MAETKPVCVRDAAVPYEQADTAFCPHCGHTAREHWVARTTESVAQWERQSAIAAAEREVVAAAEREERKHWQTSCRCRLCVAVAALRRAREAT